MLATVLETRIHEKPRHNHCLYIQFFYDVVQQDLSTSTKDS